MRARRRLPALPKDRSGRQQSRAGRRLCWLALLLCCNSLGQLARAQDLPEAAPDGAPAADAKWAPELTAIVKPAEAHLGDPITVTINVRYRRGVSVTLPLKLELGKFHELSRDEAVKEQGSKDEIPQVEHTFSLKVAAYELGELTLPAIELTALGPRGELITLPTTAVPLRIKSLTANEPQPKLKELEPPVLVYQRTWWFLYLVGALAAAGLIAATTLLINRQVRRRRERARPPAPPRPAHEIALERLAAIDVETFLAEERYKELYLLLSEIIRDYLGRRWSFDALEMTTTEIIESLASRAVAGEVRQRFIGYLNDCDLVKFAKYRPEPDGAREAVAAAAALVRESALVAPPPVAVALDPPAESRSEDARSA